MRVLGVDPGLTRCGVGIVDGVAGGPLRLVHVEVIRTPPDAEIGMRLLAVAERLEEGISRYVPDVIAVERVFSQQNVRTVMGTAQAAAMAIVAGARAGVPVVMHTPSEVKAAVTGSGRADKAQVTEMVTRLLRLPDRPRPADAADALALAICQVWRGSAQSRIDAQITAATAVQARVAQAKIAQATAQARAAHASAAQAAAIQASAAQASAAQASAAQASGAVRAGAAGTGFPVGARWQQARTQEVPQPGVTRVRVSPTQTGVGAAKVAP